MMKKFNALLLGSLLCVAALAQTTQSATTPAPTTSTTSTTPAQQTVPAAALDLDSGDVAKEMSKEQHPADTKPDPLSATNDAFEQSILNSEGQKKIVGVVSAGAGVGSVPAQHGFKGEDFTCENTAVAVNDAISNTAQLGIAAYASTCKTR